MSLIYDALKRAEDDNKRMGGVPRVGARRTLLGKRRQQWMWALVAVLGANALVVATLVVTLGYRISAPRAPEPEMRVAATPAPAPVPAAPVPAPVPATPVPAPVPAPPISAPVSAPPVSAPVSAAPVPAPLSAAPVPAPVSAPPRGAPVQPSLVAKPAPPPPATTPRAMPEAPPAVKATTPAAPLEPPHVAAPARPAVPVAPAPRVASTPPVAPTPTAEPPRTATREERVAARPERQPPAPDAARRSEARVEPETRSRPPITGDRAPEADAGAGARPMPPPAITLQVLVYSDVPAQRMVFIEGRRMVEGDAIDNDTVLERINQDGIVIRRRGVRYIVHSNRE